MTQLTGQTDIETVRDATDLVKLIGEHISLRPKGREHVGLCPFHDDHKPSLAVVTHKGNAFYKCHSCGAGGDAFDFVINYHKMDFGDALRYLADRAGIKLTKRSTKTSSSSTVTNSDLRKAIGFAAKYFQHALGDPLLGKRATEQITARDINGEMIDTFMLGAAPDQWDSLCCCIRSRNYGEKIFAAAGLIKPKTDGSFYDAFRNRLIFPICDELGRPVAFGARCIDPKDEPKYLNSSENAVFNKSKSLYGIHLAKRAIIDSKQAIVVEGYTDVIACHQAGFTNVVGTLGTALTRDHARILSRLCDTVTLVFDADQAGQKAADRGLEVFFAEPVDVRIAVLPDGLDPDSLLKQNGGSDRLNEIIHGSVDALEFKLQRFEHELGNAVGLSARQKRLEEFMNQLADLGFPSVQGIRKRLVLDRLAQLLGVSIEDIQTAMPKRRRTPANSTTQSQSTHATSVGSTLIDSDSDSWLSPARIRAEHDLLSILIYEPAHAKDILTGGGDLRVTEILHNEIFGDSIARRLADVVVPCLERDAFFTMQELLAQLPDSETKTLATSLYFQGESFCEDNLNQLAEIVDELIRSLQSHISLEQFQASVSSFQETKGVPEQALTAAQSIIEQRRQHGRIPAAISRAARS